MQQKKLRRGLALCLALIMTAVLAGCSTGSTGEEAPPPPTQFSPGTQVQALPVPVPIPVSKVHPAPTPEPDAQADSDLVPVPQVRYDFSQPVPESDAVEGDYFADAAFIGDSRSDGFMLYSGVKGAENLTYNGLSIFQLESKTCFKRDGRQMTALEALGRKSYGKVYLSLGINELGYYDDKGYYEAYLKAIDDIRSIQPDAVIYLQGLIPLNEEVIQATGGASYLTNAHLLIYNDLMQQAAQEKQVAFLDLNSFFANEEGILPAEASKDGIHMSKAYYQQWLAYLKTHTVTFEQLYEEAER